MKPKLGVVTVTYNSAAVLPGFLASLNLQDMPEDSIKVYVIDNGSADGTLALLAASELPIEVVANVDNRGFAGASNQGIVCARAAACEYILLINNDTVFDGTLFRRLLETAKASGARILTPRIDRPDPPGGFWYAGGGRRPWLAFTATLSRPIVLDRMSEATPPVDVGFASGCCLLIECTVFDQVGMLDEDYFVYCEDMDYCIRASALGIPIAYAPTITMQHEAGSLTGGEASVFSLIQRMRNQVILTRKHAWWLQRIVGFSYLQSWMVARLITKRDDLRAFRYRQNAFVAGLRATLTTPSPVKD